MSGRDIEKGINAVERNRIERLLGENNIRQEPERSKREFKTGEVVWYRHDGQLMHFTIDQGPSFNRRWGCNVVTLKTGEVNIEVSLADIGRYNP